MKRLLILSFALSLLVFFSCTEEVVPEFEVTGITINSDDYSGGGTLTVLFSVDGGSTFYETPPSGLAEGTTFIAKVTNGTNDLTGDVNEFIWESALTIDDASAATPTFTTVTSNSAITVTVRDRLGLFVVARSGGNLFQFDPDNGSLTLFGQITLNGNGLNNLRALITNPNNGMLYAGSTNAGDGRFYEIEPASLEATLINSDFNDQWWGISDMVITPDNRILAALWFKTPTSLSGMMYFDTDGSADLAGRIIYDYEVCCGKALLYGSNSNELITTDRDLDVYTSDLNGTTSFVTTLNPTGFPPETGNDLNYLQTLVRDYDGTVYALVYDDDLQDTYIATVDFNSSTMNYSAKIGDSFNERYHGLVFIPFRLLNE